jgi:subtilisin family serine protease
VFKHPVKLLWLVLPLMLAYGLPQAAKADPTSEPPAKGIVVQLAKDVASMDELYSAVNVQSANSRLATIQTLQAENGPDSHGRILFNVPPGVSPRQFAEELSVQFGDRIIYAEPDTFAISDGSTSTVELEDAAVNPTNDPLISQQWNIFAVNAPGAWDLQPEVTVPIAILDSGIDLNHKDIPKDLTCIDYYTAQPCIDPVGHGTHVSGIACALTRNGLGIAATGGGCTNLRVGRVLGPDNTGDWLTISRGIDGAVEQGVRVISMSIWAHSNFYNPHPALVDAVKRAQDAGIIVVAAAGNDGLGTGFNFPAQLPGVVAVASVDSRLRRSSFSNFGNWIAVSAPGTKVLSTLPGNRYDAWDGTSMATPAVAAALGLYLSRYPCRPGTWAVGALYQSRTPLSDPGMGGMLNMSRMLQLGTDCSINFNYHVYAPMVTH